MTGAHIPADSGESPFLRRSKKGGKKEGRKPEINARLRPIRSPLKKRMGDFGKCWSCMFDTESVCLRGKRERKKRLAPFFSEKERTWSGWRSRSEAQRRPPTKGKKGKGHESSPSRSVRNVADTARVLARPLVPRGKKREGRGSLLFFGKGEEASNA